MTTYAALQTATTADAYLTQLLATLTACSSEDMPTFAMPVRDATNQSERILSLWQGSWIAALAVGAITWGLILWPAIAFRRKRGSRNPSVPDVRPCRDSPPLIAASPFRRSRPAR